MALLIFAHATKPVRTLHNELPLVGGKALVVELLELQDRCKSASLMSLAGRKKVQKPPVSVFSPHSPQSPQHRSLTSLRGSWQTSGSLVQPVKQLNKAAIGTLHPTERLFRCCGCIVNQSSHNKMRNVRFSLSPSPRKLKESCQTELHCINWQ